MALGTQQLPYQSAQHQQMMAQQRLHHQQRAIAPAPMPTGRLYVPYPKPTYGAGTTLESNNPSVIRRNARERNRVKQVNNGFVHLRQHIPQAIVADLSNGRRGIGPGASKKLSKVDTLRMAVEYIRRLQSVIDEVDQSDASSVSSYNSCSSGSFDGSPVSSVGMASTPFGMPQQPHPHYDLGYAGKFQQQMVSPAASTSSSAYSDPASTGSYYENDHGHESLGPAHLKYEPSTYEDYPNTSAEDEELLDYISLWQEGESGF